MIPESDQWFTNDGNEPITHDWTNEIQRGVDLRGSFPTNGGTFPLAEEGGVPTTIPFGGGRFIVVQHADGIIDTGSDIIDSHIDWTNRFIVVWGGFYDAANKLPGGAAEPVWQPSFDRLLDPSGAAPVDCVIGYLSAASTVVLNGAPPAIHLGLTVNAGNDLVLTNNEGLTLYASLLILVTDQFPTRVP